MTVALLCLVVCRMDAITVESASVQLVESVSPLHVEHGASCASLCEKEDDMLRAVREMGQWGIPSVSVTLQGTVGRVLTYGKTLQRINRAYSILFIGESVYMGGRSEAMCQTLSSKRFYLGYYIYYRCQMRC